MGNRALLFTVDSIPEPDHPPDSIRGLSEIPAIVRGCEILVAGDPLPPWLARLPGSWQEELGLYWSDVLYYAPARRD
jgi:hypothetical protein